MFATSRDEIETGLHITDVLFHTRLSKMAAEAFLAWFLGRSGRASKEEVADFADSLASGTAGSRLSRSSFYGGVLRKFLDAGLIALIPEFDYGKRRAVKVYRSVAQPVPKRRPPKPSLLYNSHLIAEQWNREIENLRKGPLSSLRQS